MNIHGLLTACFLLIGVPAMSQRTLTQKDAIAITPVVSDELHLPSGVLSILETKTRQMLTSNGLANYSERFVLVPNITVLTKNVTPTAPPMFSMELEISFYVLDAVEGTIMNEISYTKKGINREEHKAFIQAINEINPRSAEVKRFIDATKERLIEYYKMRTPVLLKQAEALAAQSKYEDALMVLSNIPENMEGYEVVAGAMASIHKQYVNREADFLINEAKGYLTTKKYPEAMEALAQVDPLSDRYKTAISMVDQLKASIEARERAARAAVEEKEKAAIARQMQIYEDKKAAAQKAHDDQVEITKLSIAASRDV
ncbi:MAG: hypothetical protein LBQ78_05595, partial [Tannerellaceae bacterium]|nr:hypothetical protein [Tannerellaceae bacterium]